MLLVCFSSYYCNKIEHQVNACPKRHLPAASSRTQMFSILPQDHMHNSFIFHKSPLLIVNWNMKLTSFYIK